MAGFFECKKSVDGELQGDVTLSFGRKFLERCNKAFGDLKAGLGDGYPICCVLNYCLTNLVESSSRVERCIWRFDGREYIPCYLHGRLRDSSTERQIERYLKSGGG